jgi:hypothetical protein
MLISRLMNLLKKSLKGFMSSQLLKAPYLTNNLILPSYFSMLKTIYSTPWK